MQLFGDSIMSKLANRVDAFNSLNKLAQKAKPASALRNKEQGLPQRSRAQSFVRTALPTGVVSGRATAAHAKVNTGSSSSSNNSGTWKPPKLIQESKRKLAQSQKFGYSLKGKNRYFRPPQQDH